MHAGDDGWPITFYERIGKGTPRKLCTVKTDGAGWVRLRYVIPRSPSADNIRLSASFPGGINKDFGIPYIPSVSPWVVVPITR